MTKKIDYFRLALLVIAGISTFVIGFSAVFLINPARFSKELAINRDRLPRAFIVQSGSMEPAVKVGSLVVTLPYKNYGRGDVITFSQSGRKSDLITHRVVFTGSNGFITQGDANEEPDTSEVATDKILGKVVINLPYVGYIANFAKEPRGFILLVVVPATIVIYEELKTILKELKRLMARVSGKFRSKKNLESQLIQSNKVAYLPKVAAVVPLVGAFFVIVAVSVAYFFDHEASLQNTLGAAASYEEVVPLAPQNIEQLVTDQVIVEEVSPTLTPTPTKTESQITAEPTPTVLPEE